MNCRIIISVLTQSWNNINCQRLSVSGIRTSTNQKPQATANPLRDRKAKAEGQKEQNFVDWKRLHVIGGKGGDGVTSFLHLWCNENAGPDGGDGGNGGHVIFQASSSAKSLQWVKTEYRGDAGESGRNKDCSGKSADHTFIQVPVGTFVKNANDDRVLASLNAEGDMYLAARGGAGGKGNHFYMTNENKAPHVCQLGGNGEDRLYTLEMRTIAHAGLIGFPNAGKSTLLRAISRAKPKVAAYPFTTLRPHVGTILYDDYEQLAVADIPGLIPDAHLNRGLGIAFLKHIERCLCLLYVIDLSQNEPWYQLEVLRDELEHYQPGLSQRPNAIIGNKIDVPEAQRNLLILQEKISLPVIPISAKMGINILRLLTHLRKLYDDEKMHDKLNLS